MNPRRTSTSPEAFPLRVSRNKGCSAEYLNVEPRKGCWPRTSIPITGNPGGKTTAKKDQLRVFQKMGAPPPATHSNPIKVASVNKRRISGWRMERLKGFERHILTRGDVLETHTFNDFKNNTIRKPPPNNHPILVLRTSPVTPDPPINGNKGAGHNQTCYHLQNYERYSLRFGFDRGCKVICRERLWRWIWLCDTSYHCTVVVFVVVNTLVQGTILGSETTE